MKIFTKKKLRNRPRTERKWLPISNVLHSYTKFVKNADFGRTSKSNTLNSFAVDWTPIVENNAIAENNSF